MMPPRSPHPLNSLGLWSDGRISSVLSVSPFSFLRLHRAPPHPRLVQLPRPFLFFSEPKILIVPTVIYQSGTLFFNRQKKKKELIDAASCKGIISQGYPSAKGGSDVYCEFLCLCVLISDSDRLIKFIELKLKYII